MYLSRFRFPVASRYIPGAPPPMKGDATRSRYGLCPVSCSVGVYPRRTAGVRGVEIETNEEALSHFT